MGNYLLVAGLLLNSCLIMINRYVKPIPAPVHIPLLLVGIGLIIAGGLMMR